MAASVLIISDENNIAKLAFGNCYNRLWYSLETCNSLLKSLQYRCFPVNFANFLRTSFTELLRTTASGFFIHFTVLPPGELIETVFFYFWTCFTRHSNVMNIMNLNDLVLAAWKHTFLGDVTWNLAVFCRMISISIGTYWISVLHCPATIQPWNT